MQEDLKSVLTGKEWTDVPVSERCLKIYTMDSAFTDRRSRQHLEDDSNVQSALETLWDILARPKRTRKKREMWKEVQVCSALVSSSLYGSPFYGRISPS